MKRMLTFMLMIFVLLINSDVYADDMCTRVNINRLKNLAKNIEITYEHNVYNDNNGLVSVYDVMLSGLTDEMYVVDDSDNNYYYDMVVDNLLSIKLFSGQRKLYIYSKNCLGIILDVVNLDLPKFNFNSLNEECKREEFIDLDICSKFLANNEDIVSEEEFKEQIELEQIKNDNLFSKFKKIIFQNKYLVIVGGLCLFFIIMLLVVIRKRKERLE